MYGELFDAILTQKKIRDANFSECQNVFFDHQTGMPMSKDFRPTWEKALASVNLAGRLFHDLRRTAVRNMVRSGVSEVVAMRVSGHKTRNVFDRYNITSEDDIKLACERLSTMHQENSKILSQEHDGHNLGTLKIIQGGKQ
jgi:integrase